MWYMVYSHYSLWFISVLYLLMVYGLFVLLILSHIWSNVSTILCLTEATLYFNLPVTTFNVPIQTSYFPSHFFHYLTSLVSLLLTASNWLKFFLSSLLLFSNLYLHYSSFLTASVFLLTPKLFVATALTWDKSLVFAILWLSLLQ